MQLTPEQKLDLGAALDEATLLGVELDRVGRIASVTLAVLTLPESGPVPDDRRVQLRLGPVGRVVASLRIGDRDDPNAEVVSFGIEELLATVQSFGGLAIYGEKYFDVHEAQLADFGDRISLDWRSGNGGMNHSLSLFQEAGDRILDLCIWFDELEIRNPSGEAIPFERFVADGKRWWEALYSGDERTVGYGIIPSK